MDWRGLGREYRHTLHLVSAASGGHASRQATKRISCGCVQRMPVMTQVSCEAQGMAIGRMAAAESRATVVVRAHAGFDVTFAELPTSTLAHVLRDVLIAAVDMCQPLW